MLKSSLTLLILHRLKAQQYLKFAAEDSVGNATHRTAVLRQQEQESAWRKNLAMHEEYIRKEINAKSMKMALHSSIDLSRASLLEEKKLKKLQASSSSARIARLSEESSSIVSYIVPFLSASEFEECDHALVIFVNTFVFFFSFGSVNLLIIPHCQVPVPDEIQDRIKSATRYARIL